MADYGYMLNRDNAQVKTPFVYDADVAQWMAKTQNYVWTGSLWVPQKSAAGGEIHAQLTGSTTDLRGLAVNKPAATLVGVGITYWSVDTNVVEVSNGTNWVVI